MVEGLGRKIGEMTDEFIAQISEKYLSAMDTILSDPHTSPVEKIGMIKVLADGAWSKMASITYGNPKLTVEDVGNMEQKE